jgi:hypothetical protein
MVQIERCLTRERNQKLRVGLCCVNEITPTVKLSSRSAVSHRTSYGPIVWSDNESFIPTSVRRPWVAQRADGRVPVVRSRGWRPHEEQAFRRATLRLTRRSTGDCAGAGSHERQPWPASAAASATFRCASRMDRGSPRRPAARQRECHWTSSRNLVHAGLQLTRAKESAR